MARHRHLGHAVRHGQHDLLQARQVWAVAGCGGEQISQGRVHRLDVLHGPVDEAAEGHVTEGLAVVRARRPDEVHEVWVVAKFSEETVAAAEAVGVGFVGLAQHVQLEMETREVTLQVNETNQEM